MYSFLLNILMGVKGEYISLIIFNVFMGLVYVCGNNIYIY